ncbi:hypothetical protein, partial [Pseudactinotalea sp.]|uniref:hypothetical protein n=1 Tax=Pseudactinotalea sp. TaxID=1926260 RepID=UPI003B3B4E5C
MAGSGVPRTAVIAAAWSRLRGVEVLSGADGGPLSRTVKCVLDPLVIRPAAHPALAVPLLEPEAAAALTQRLLDHAEVLRDTAAWYPVLKQRRRALRITAGNPQETCFPVAFELATTRGAPGQDAADVADTALADRAADHPDPPLHHLL